MPRSPRVPKILGDMRLVYRTDPSLDKTPAQRALREMLERKPQTFMAQLQRLEDAHRKRLEDTKASYAGAIEAEADEGEQKVLELAEKILGEYRGKKPAPPPPSGPDPAVPG